jgi:hypothetical protein
MVSAEMNLMVRQMEEMRHQIATMAEVIDALSAATGQPYRLARMEPVREIPPGTVGLPDL